MNLFCYGRCFLIAACFLPDVSAGNDGSDDVWHPLQHHTQNVYLVENVHVLTLVYQNICLVLLACVVLYSCPRNAVLHLELDLPLRTSPPQQG